MPWKIRKQGVMYAVVKESDGRVVGKHATRAQAIKHLRALYVHEKGRAK